MEGMLRFFPFPPQRGRPVLHLSKRGELGDPFRASLVPWVGGHNDRFPREQLVP